MVPRYVIPVTTVQLFTEECDERSHVDDPTMSPLLQVRDLTVDIGTESISNRLLDRVSFELGSGEITGLVGESGSGKTLTGLALLGLLPRTATTSGSIRLEGQELVGLPAAKLRKIRGRDVSMVFQDPSSALNPSVSIGRQIVDVLKAHRDITKVDAEDVATDLLHQVGLADPSRTLKLYGYELSGGMCQRVMIAMALACGPKLLIADEPTTALDVTIQAQIVDLLRELAEQRDLAVLLISHDLAVVAEVADRVITMFRGEIVDVAPRDVLLRRPAHPYTFSLLEAARSTFEEVSSQSPKARGDFTSKAPADGVGCRYVARCNYSEELCISDHPLLIGSPETATRCHRSDELELLGLVS